MGSTLVKADLSNWRNSPYNQWGFVNVEKVLNTSVIEKSDQPSPLEQGESRKWDQFRIQTQSETLDLAQFISHSSTDGLIVLHHGKVVYEEYFRGNDVDSRHILMSMTKSVTGLLVGILQSHGKLHVDDLVTKYVPEVSSTPYKDVTIRQCIDMRSGVVFPDGNHGYRYAAGWDVADDGSGSSDSEKFADLHEFIAHFDPPRAVDDRFEYVSVNTDLVGWAVERACGKKFAEVVEELLWKPLGMESDALMALDRKGNARAAGGLCATLRDVARIGRMIVEDGSNSSSSAEGTIVPAEWLHDIVHGGDREAFEKSTWGPGFGRLFASPSYRSYFVADRASEVVIAMGVHGQHLFADRTNGIVVVKTGSQTLPLDNNLIGMNVLAFKEFQRILTGGN